MSHSSPRANRARRRHNPHLKNADRQPPEGWPTGATLTEALGINALAAQLLEELQPETMRTILKRMDVKARTAVLEPRSIPAAKVSLRAASQVLALARAEEKPAESTMLGTILAPAADLFDQAVITRTQLTGLRLKLVDLALPLIAYSESVFQGLRTWHRWADEAYEDITLAVVIGLDCTNSALAAAYLSAGHPQIARRYEELREEYPAIPAIAEARLTPSNPLSRYLAARPDRRAPANTTELRNALSEDNRTRIAELEQARDERRRATARHKRRSAAADGERPAATTTAPPAEARPVGDTDVWQTMLPADLAALPGVSDWAAAVTDSRELTEQLVAGRVPDLNRLASIAALRLRLDNMSRLLGHVLGQPVDATRSDIDRALTLVLSDPEASERLGPLPRTVAEVATRMGRLGLPVASPAAPTSSAAPAASSDSGTTSTPPTTGIDLSDLDDILDGEAGAQLVALARANLAPEPNPPRPTDHRAPQVESDPDDSTPPPGSAAAAPVPETSAAPGKAGPPPTNDAARTMTAVALNARIPGGVLAAGYAELAIGIDDDPSTWTESDRALAICSALPMALVDPLCGAVDLLALPPTGLSHCPRLLELRDEILQLAQQSLSPLDSDVARLSTLTARYARVRDEAREIHNTAATRTLKYDKATKVYHHWMAPGGRLRELVDALAGDAGPAVIAELAGAVGRTSASRAVDDTTAEVFGTGRPRIVAGARKTLTERYTEVLDLADRAVAIAEEVGRVRDNDRSVAWRYEQITRFRDRVDTLIPAVESELDNRLAAGALPHPWIVALATRALAVAISPLPQPGPELTVGMARRWLDTDGTSVAPR